MSLYAEYITLTTLMGHLSDDPTEVEIDVAASLARQVMADSISVITKITELFDENLDDGGSWDEIEVCQRVSYLLQRAGFFLDCPAHGVYARNKPQCPTCEMEESQ